MGVKKKLKNFKKTIDNPVLLLYIYQCKVKDKTLRLTRSKNMAALDLKRIIERNKEYFGSYQMTNEEFLDDGLFETVWNSKGYLIEDVGVSFILNTLRNGSNITNEDKVKIFDAVLNDWMKEVFKEINWSKKNNGR